MSPSAFLLLLLLSGTAKARFRNLALGQPTSQSSEYSNGVSSRAVDGNRNTKWSGSSCSHTKKDGPAWWAVNLTAEHVIEQVIIYYRDDCCHDYMGGANVYVDDVLCEKVEIAGLNPVVLNCPSMVGARVSIYLPKLLELMLCEVEVMGHNLQPQFSNLGVLPKIDQHVHQININHGSDLEFPVEISYATGFPHPSLSIYPTSENIFIQDNCLVVKNASKELQGGYALTATSEQSSVSRLVILNVTGSGPEFVGLLSHITTPVAVRFEITATTVGTPAPAMTLRKVLSETKEVLFTDIRSSQRGGVTVLSYYINSPSEADSGHYIISARNEYGVNETEVVVQVGAGSWWPFVNLLTVSSLVCGASIASLYYLYTKIEAVAGCLTELELRVDSKLREVEAEVECNKEGISGLVKDTVSVADNLRDCGRKVGGVLTRLNEMERDVMVNNKCPEPPAYTEARPSFEYTEHTE